MLLLLKNFDNEIPATRACLNPLRIETANKHLS